MLVIRSCTEVVFNLKEKYLSTRYAKFPDILNSGNKWGINWGGSQEGM
jgi:hypothetical protein